MRKNYSVFVTLTMTEAIEIINDHLKRKGLLKNIPGSAEIAPWDDTGEVCIEYNWSEE